jgi:acetyltransferase-like isoleucine patch superfamily enzyme
MIKVHPLADVQTTNIGDNTTIWQFAIVLPNASIGKNCNINCHTFIENDVTIGNNVTIKAGVYLWDGIDIQDNVFIGPNAAFTNDKFPKSRKYTETFQKIVIEKGSSIGAQATILGGVRVGQCSLVAAGSVVTKNVPAFAIVKGNPARISGWLDENGEKLAEVGINKFIDAEGNEYKVEGDVLIKKGINDVLISP